MFSSEADLEIRLRLWSWFVHLHFIDFCNRRAESLISIEPETSQPVIIQRGTLGAYCSKNYEL